MSRPREEITADLDQIRGTLSGLRAGFIAMRPMLESKIGAFNAAGAIKILETLFAQQLTLVLVVGELEERLAGLEHVAHEPFDFTQLVDRIASLEKSHAAIVAGLENVSRELAA
jgi:hypothetical protein